MKVVLPLVKRVRMNASPALISVKRILVWNNVKERVESVLISVADAQRNAERVVLLLHRL